jgi:hypothetical protein
MTLIHVGDLVRISGVVETSDTAVDPTVVKFSYKAPSAAAVTYTYNSDLQLVKDSTGHYHVDVSVTEPGQWYYKFWSTGTGQGAFEDGFVVERTQF